jgi:hypothetical protein
MTRLIVLAVALSALAGCSGSPQSIGITGAPQPKPPTAPNDDTLANPGVPQAPTRFNSSVQPSTGSGQYYGY